MSTATLKLCSWGGIATIALMLIGLGGFAGFVPPPAPGLDADAVAALYANNSFGIKFGWLLMTVGAACMMPFVAAISVQMKRMEGPLHPLSYVQLGLGALFVIEFIIPAFAGITAAYRPDRSPEVTQAINDFCWLLLVGVVSTAVLQVAVIAIAILADRNPDPVFPRWLGYFNIWVTFLFSPGAVIPFFKSGPLAWNGLFTWWMPLSVFGIWFIVMTWQLLASIRRLETAKAASAMVA